MTQTLTQPFKLPLSKAMQTTGQGNPATAASGAFGLALTSPDTTGGTIRLVSQVANNSTVTDTTLLDLTFPFEGYEAGVIPLNIDAGLVIAAGGAATTSLTVSVREIDGTGAFGPELVTSGSPIALTGTVDVTNQVMVNTATLGIGDELVVAVGMQIVATGTANVTGHISGVSFGP